MGTRSITTIRDEHGPVAEFYQQFDGYPEGWGQKLYEFLAGFTVVNGLSGRPTKVANGAGCLAAQVIAEFKERAGGLYMQAPGSGRQEFNWVVTAIPGEPIRMSVEGHGQAWDGRVDEFPAWLQKYLARDE